MKSPFLRLTGALVGVGMLLAACNIPAKITFESLLSGQATPTSEATEEPAAPASSLDWATVGSSLLWFDNSVLVYVPQGEFVMGGQDEDNPEHTVYLDDFWIYRFDVTNDMYRLCVTAGVCTPPADEPPYKDYTDAQLKDRPVVGVDWEQAQTYCEWMNARLPSEAEWEKTSRGTQADPYPWGQADPSCDLLNFESCLGRTSNVADYPEGMSYYTAYDTAGNVFEWAADWYQADYYSQAPTENPLGPELGEVRSVRSSSFQSESEQLPSAQRFFLEPEKYRQDLGFRCVVSDPSLASFAPFCQVSAFIPGGPGIVPGFPPGGPEPGGEPVEPPPCEPPDVSVAVSSYCADQPTQTGGANAAISPHDALLSYGADCSAVGPDMLVCTGPENTSTSIEVCTACEPGLILEAGLAPSCAFGYTLAPDGWCEFSGFPPIPGGDCPPTWHYDPDTDMCVAPLPPSELCPEGYGYFPSVECCGAAFTEPTSGSSGIPGWAYPGCPIGYSYDAGLHLCFPTTGGPGDSSGICRTITVDLGNCANPGENNGDEPDGEDGGQPCVDPPGCQPPPNCGGANPCCVCP